MRRYTLLLILLGLTTQIFGQLNPINNLYYDHDYYWNPPANFFTLSWELPDLNSDTLIGFNVYGGNECYRFQTEIGVYCEEYDSTGCDYFLEFLQPYEYMKVTAVYNNSMQESIVIDSIEFDGLSVGIDDFNKEINNKLFPNPTKGKITIEAENIEELKVLNASGFIIHEQRANSIIDLSACSPGIYFIKIITDSGTEIKKVILK